MYGRCGPKKWVARKNGVLCLRRGSAPSRAQHLDGAGGQVVLEGGLDGLVQPGGQEVAGAAVGGGAAYGVGDAVRREAVLLQVGEVVRVVHRVVPAGQVGTLEAVVGGGAPHTPVPLAHEPQPVALGAQLAGEGELVVGEVLQIAHVALVVGQQLVAEGGRAGEQAGAGRGADGGGGVEAVEAGALGGEPVQVGGADVGVAIGTEGVHAVLVGHEEEHVGAHGDPFGSDGMGSAGATG